MKGYSNMTIPELAAELRQIGASNGIPALNQIADALRRRRVSVPAKPTNRKATSELKRQIAAFARANVGMSNHEIGLVFGVSAGVVSDAISRQE